MDDLILFGGTANPGLAQSVAEELGIELAPSSVERFPDGEVMVRLERTVRGREICILQPTSPPVDTHLIELLAFAATARKAAAARITAVVPYFGYARSDRRGGRREPIMARLVADLAEAAGIDHILMLDLHSPQIEGFFRVPAENLTAAPLLMEALRPLVTPEAVVVSPDAGRVKSAAGFADRLGLPLVILHKHRESGHKTTVACLVGDVEGRRCIMVDDMISTGGTLASGARALVEAGAEPDVVAVATHGLFTADARTRLVEAGIHTAVVTDSVTVDSGLEGPDVRVVSVAPLLADAVRRIHSGESLRELFA